VYVTHSVLRCKNVEDVVHAISVVGCWLLCDFWGESL